MKPHLRLHVVREGQRTYSWCVANYRSGERSFWSASAAGAIRNWNDPMRSGIDVTLKRVVTA